MLKMSTGSKKNVNQHAKCWTITKNVENVENVENAHFHGHIGSNQMNQNVEPNETNNEIFNIWKGKGREFSIEDDLFRRWGNLWWNKSFDKYHLKTKPLKHLSIFLKPSNETRLKSKVFRLLTLYFEIR